MPFPIVNKEIVFGALKANQQQYEEFINKTRRENPQFIEILELAASVFETEEEQDLFLCGAAFAINILRAQIESDELKNQWENKDG